MAAFTHKQANAIRTQWTLKPNWHFSFYRQGHQDMTSQELAGHILTQGDDVNKLLDQLEDTEIWSQDSADSEKE